MLTKIKKINGSEIISLEHYSLGIYKNNSSIKNLFTKYKSIDEYFNVLFIRIVVKDLHKAIITLKEDNIIQILDVNEFLLLKAYCTDVEEKEELSLDNLEFNVILIENKSFKQDFFIFNTLLQFSSFTKNGKLNFENFNKEVANYLNKNNKKLSNYILNARKCLFNSLYGFSTLKRLNKSKDKNQK